MYLHGLLLGLSLSVLIGPMLFAIIQASLERGFRAGLSVAVGIWMSDVMFLYFLYHGMGPLAKLIALPNFKMWAGFAGGGVLLLLATITLLSKRTPDPNDENTADRLLDKIDGPEPEGVDHNWKRWGYLGYCLRGFLLNTINPFTVFFWVGIASTVIIPNQWTRPETVWFFSGMLTTLMLADTAKAYAAKRLRDFLTPRHIRLMQRVIGVLMLIFGIVLIIRVL